MQIFRNKKMSLVLNQSHIVKPKTFITKEYFVTNPKKKIWVSRKFTRQITSAYSNPIKVRGIEGVTHFKSKSNDTENISKIGGEIEVRRYAFTPDQIADLIDLQLNCEEGELLTDGFWNIFYMVGKGGALLVVSLYFHSGCNRWGIDTWCLKDYNRWISNYRVFCNTSPLLLEA
jgi:hypothetical protein